MNVPKGFKPEKGLEEKTRKLQKSKRIREISDLILEGRIPDGYFLFNTKNISNIRVIYEYMLPLQELKSDLRLLYKSPDSENKQDHFRVDLLEFSNASSVSKNLKKFYNVKHKLNNRLESQVEHDLLIKGKYVVFFRAFKRDVLKKFVQEYKKRFNMKGVEAKFYLK